MVAWGQVMMVFELDAAVRAATQGVLIAAEMQCVELQFLVTIVGRGREPRQVDNVLSASECRSK